MFKIWKGNIKIKNLFKRLDYSGIHPRMTKTIYNTIKKKNYEIVNHFALMIYKIENKNKLYIKIIYRQYDINGKYFKKDKYYYCIYYLPKGYKTNDRDIIYIKNNFLIEYPDENKFCNIFENGKYTKKTQKVNLLESFHLNKRGCKTLTIKTQLDKNLSEMEFYNGLDFIKKTVSEYYYLIDLIERLWTLKDIKGDYFKFQKRK